MRKFAIDDPRIKDKQLMKDEQIAKAIKDAKLIEEFLEMPVWKEVLKPHLEKKVKDSIEALLKKEEEQVVKIGQLRGIARTYIGIKGDIEEGFSKLKERALEELERKEKREKRK